MKPRAGLLLAAAWLLYCGSCVLAVFFPKWGLAAVFIASEAGIIFQEGWRRLK